MTRHQIMRKASYLARRETVTKMLCDWLDATTTYREPETPRTPRWKGWTTFYGANLNLVPDGKLLDSDGKPTAYVTKRQWTAEPGEIIIDRSRRKYMVRPDHSLRKIS